MPSPAFPPLLACLPPGIWRGGPRVEARVFPCHAGRIDGTLPGAAPLFRKDSSPNLATFSRPALAVCVCVAERLPSFVGDALLHRSIPRPPFWCAVSTSLVLAFADSYLLFVFYCRFVLIAGLLCNACASFPGVACCVSHVPSNGYLGDDKLSSSFLFTCLVKTAFVKLNVM